MRPWGEALFYFKAYFKEIFAQFLGAAVIVLLTCAETSCIPYV